MAADLSFVLLFPTAGKEDALAGLADLCDPPGTSPAEDGGIVLRLPADDTVRDLLFRQGYGDRLQPDGFALIYLELTARIRSSHPFGGVDRGEVFELDLWPPTTGLSHICRDAPGFRALLVALLERCGGMEGWLDSGRGGGDQFWPG